MPDPCLLIPEKGGVAQLGERLLCKQEVIGSNPFTSTIPGTIRRLEKIKRHRPGQPGRGCCLKGEERVCHVTEADRLGPQGPLSAKRSFACRGRKQSLRRVYPRSVFM